MKLYPVTQRLAVLWGDVPECKEAIYLGEDIFIDSSSPLVEYRDAEATISSHHHQIAHCIERLAHVTQDALRDKFVSFFDEDVARGVVYDKKLFSKVGNELALTHLGHAKRG